MSRDHAIHEMILDQGGKITPKITHPEDVLAIHDKETLELNLKHYDKANLIDAVPDSSFARLNYVRYTRPALRYYCAKFGVKVPDYLKDDKYYLEMPKEEKEHLFGKKHFKVHEFKKIPRIKGRVTGGADAQ